MVITMIQFLGRSCKELGEVTGIDISRWSNYLNGRVSPTYDTLERAADAFEMEVGEFVQHFKEYKDFREKAKSLGTGRGKDSLSNQKGK